MREGARVTDCRHRTLTGCALGRDAPRDCQCAAYDPKPHASLSLFRLDIDAAVFACAALVGLGAVWLMTGGWNG